jgi:drug/metabolite transporter (DMT)-like permease
MKNAKVIYISAMLIFGSIGIFVRFIDLTSGQIALVRGMIGCVFLLAACLVMKQKLSWKAIRPNLLFLILSGAGIGFNWILLFQAYRYTTIANATLSYYFAPVFIMFLSPLILREKLTAVRMFCILGAVLGMFFIVGINQEAGNNNIIGIGYGLLAAVLYAGVVITNKFFKGLSGLETTLIQLGSAALVLLPYILLTEKIMIFQLDLKSAILLITVGIIHTGLAYLLYFTAIRHLNGQTIAVFSYIDPISAIILASIIFTEPMTIMQVLGGALILGATFISEISARILKSNSQKEAGRSE